MTSVKLPSRKAFRAEGLQTELEQEGFVRFPLLDKELIAELKKRYSELENPELNQPFYTSNWSADRAYRKRVDEMVRPLIENLVLDKLNDYKACFGYYLVKRVSSESKFNVHQDWSMVDETKFTGLTLWAPLVDTNTRNGCFHIVKRSHLFSDAPRGAGISSTYIDIKQEIEDNFCTPIHMNAGEAIIFDHRLWHYSPANHSQEDRVAVGLVLIPQETTFVHYKAGKQGSVTLFETNDEFLIDTGFGDDVSKLGYKMRSELSLENQPYNIRAFKRDYAAHNGNEHVPDSLVRRLVDRILLH